MGPAQGPSYRTVSEVVVLLSHHRTILADVHNGIPIGSEDQLHLTTLRLWGYARYVWVKRHWSQEGDRKLIVTEDGRRALIGKDVVLPS